MRKFGRNQEGFVLVELLVVLAVLGILAGIVVWVVGGIYATSQAQVCRMEQRIVVTALQASAAANLRGEFPAVAGIDGLDGARNSGFLEWGETSRYWRYDAPVVSGGLTAANLIRVNTAGVASGDCPA